MSSICRRGYKAYVSTVCRPGNYFKLLAYSLVSICCARYRCISSKYLAVAFSPIEKHILEEEYNDVRIYGLVGDGLMQSIRNHSVVGVVPYTKRIPVLFSALKYSREDSIPYSFCLEFALLEKAVTECIGLIDSVSTAVHYERYAIWLADLCERYSLGYKLFQHGTVIGLTPIENKISVNDAYVFNEIEQRYFSSAIVKNSDCVYHRRPFKSSITFKESNISGHKVALISQGDYRFDYEIIESIVCCGVDLCLFYYIHPASSIPRRVIKKCASESVVICPNDRFSDVDLVVTKNSTMVYDYLYCSTFYGKILCVDDQFRFDGFDSVDVVNDVQAVIERVCTL
ncbi:hypothetical protein [Adlercreutzia sp. ZJ138]|uniref:hypothetical protein n=1 Tax=Adlercreutzia sp. ZJ138 TaxID=2709405 RepID=UPI0013E9A3FE|nr:hypothetical protein [Adlercreutzia sp. ZJ138]